MTHPSASSFTHSLQRATSTCPYSLSYKHTNIDASKCMSSPTDGGNKLIAACVCWGCEVRWWHINDRTPDSTTRWPRRTKRCSRFLIQWGLFQSNNGSVPHWGLGKGERGDFVRGSWPVLLYFKLQMILWAWWSCESKISLCSSNIRCCLGS